MISFTIIVVVLIVCATFLIDEYICYCDRNEIDMFANHEYEKRICKLEKIVNELRQN